MKIGLYFVFVLVVCMQTSSSKWKEKDEVYKHGEEGIELIRQKRFICGGFCIASVIIGVTSLTGSALGMANKEMDGALFRPSIKELKKELKEEDSRIKELEKAMSTEANKMNEYKEESKDMLMLVGVWQDKLNMMKEIYDAAKNLPFVNIHETILSKLENGVFSLKTFSSFWEIQVELNILQTNYQQAFTDAASTCEEAENIKQTLSVIALNLIFGELLDTIKFSDKKKKILEGQLKLRREHFDNLERYYHRIVIQSRKLKCRNDLVNTVNKALRILSTGLGDLKLIKCTTTRETLENDLMELTNNWEDIVWEFQRELDKIKKSVTKSTLEHEKNMTNAISKLPKRYLQDPKNLFQLLLDPSASNGVTILRAMNDLNILPKKGVFLMEQLTNCSLPCGGGYYFHHFYCLGPALECDGSFHKSEEKQCNGHLCPTTCPLGWEMHYGSCYKLSSSVPLKIKDIDTECQQNVVYGKQASTLIVESTSEETLILKLIEEQHQTSSKKGWFYKKSYKGLLTTDVCHSIQNGKMLCEDQKTFHFICERQLQNQWLLNKLLPQQCTNRTTSPPTRKKASSKCEKAVKGWDFTVIIKEEKVNQILPEVFRTVMKPNILGDYQHLGEVDLAQGQSWGIRSTIKMTRLSIAEMHLSVREGQDHEGKLSVTFSSGFIRISKDLVGFDQHIPPSFQDINLAGKMIKYRIKMKANNMAVSDEGKDVYVVKLEIDDYETIIGHLDLYKLSLFDAGVVRKAFAAHMKTVLHSSSQFVITRFVVPLKYPDHEDVAKNLFPETFPLLWTYASNDHSYITAVATTKLCTSC